MAEYPGYPSQADLALGSRLLLFTWCLEESCVPILFYWASVCSMHSLSLLAFHSGVCSFLVLGKT